MIRDDGGFTMAELLVGMAVSVVTMSAIAMMVSAATHHQARVANRVAANQRARPVIARIIDELHSACVAPRIAPVVGDGTANGSTATRITFLSLAGNDPNPRPDKRVIVLSGDTLTESVYQGNGSTSPNGWSFSPTPTPDSPRTLISGVSAPGGAVFNYYRFQNGQLVLNPPLTVPLTSSDAALVAYVGVSLTANPTPTGGTGPDANAPITLSDGVDLRLQPASQIATQDNLPCT